MLKANIDIDDLMHPPALHGGGIRFGRSGISPFPSPCLRSLFLQTDKRWIYAVYERSTSDMDERLRAPHGALSYEDFAGAHRQIVDWPLDYVLIEAALNGCGAQVRITAGPLGVAPLYAAAQAGSVLLSWDCADLLTCGNHAADFEVLAHTLGMRTFYASRQVCTGIAMLTERSSLTLDATCTSFLYPPAAPAIFPHALQDGVDVLTVFELSLAHAMARRPLDAIAWMAELSGGMDSASVSVAAAHILRIQGSSAGILLSGTDRTFQSRRRQGIVQALGLRDKVFDMSEYMPDIDLDPSARQPEHPLGEFYIEAFDAMWGHAAKHGCRAILTGIGGDELFPRYEGENLEASGKNDRRLVAAEEVALSMLTRRAKGARNSEPLYCAPNSAVPQTGLLAHAARAPYMLRRGLWPVNPLCDPALVAFCHRLPEEFRVERQLLRLHLRRHLKHEFFPIGYQKETFDYVFPEVIRCHYQRLTEQLKECALADIGLVDMTAVREVFNHVAATGDVVATAPLVIFLSLERFMRQIA